MVFLNYQSEQTIQNKNASIVIAWIVTLLVSSLIDIFFIELTESVPYYLFWVKFGLLFLLIILSWCWKLLTALRPFLIMLLLLATLMKTNSWFFGSSSWEVWQNEKSFTVLAVAAQSIEVLLSLLLIGFLFLLRKKRPKFFFVKGNLKATIGPMKLFGQKYPDPLWKFGLIFTLVVIIVQFFMFLLPLSINIDTIKFLLPLIPVIILLAAFNGFSEEIIFRAAPISTAYEVVGKTNAVWMAAVIFGLAHYIGGIPSGIIGVFTTIFLGWFFGKCMIESKGLFFPWLFHFMQDIIPFTLMTLVNMK